MVLLINGNITYNQQMRIIVIQNQETKYNNIDYRDNTYKNEILTMSFIMECVAIIGVIVGINIYTRSINRNKNNFKLD